MKVWVNFFGIMAWLFASQSLQAQAPEYSFQSSDSLMAMELKRESGAVVIALQLYDASDVEYALIERSTDIQTNFNQCGYVAMHKVAEDSFNVSKKDFYSPAISAPMYYRVKLVSREGFTRIYPAVKLPALSSEKNPIAGP